MPHVNFNMSQAITKVNSDVNNIDENQEIRTLFIYLIFLILKAGNHLHKNKP